MIEISFDDSFKRAFKKRFKGNHELERKFRTKLEKFKENPFDPSLKTHKLYKYKLLEKPYYISFA